MVDKFDTWAEAYAFLRDGLLNAPEVQPRGQRTKELLSVNFALNNPRSRFGYHELRKYNLAFALAEAVLLFQDDRSVEYPAFFNKSIRFFSDDGQRLHGAYGYRISNHLREFIAKLKSDVHSRQAVMNIFETHDMEIETKDVPCTIALQGMIRYGKFNLHVYMRSNDLIWGTMYDVPAFTILQEVIANELGIDVGTYYHNATSLHVYERHFELLEQMWGVEPISATFHHTIDDMVVTAGVLKDLVNDAGVNRFAFSTAEPFSDVFAWWKDRKKKALIPFQHNIPEWAEVFTR